MQLKGILERSLGGFPCIRGFSSLGNLANLSAPNPKIQRNLIETQSEAIRAFLADKSYLFFPEVILAYTIKYDFYLPEAQSGLSPLNEIVNRNKFTSNVDGISIWSQKTGIQKATVNIPNKHLKSDEKPFDRIDGNHRLSAAFLEEEFKHYNTPFCLILLAADNESEAKKRVIFHNINYKSIPLTPEQNYKLIVDQENDDVFSDSKLQEERREFGWHFYLARKMLSRVRLDDFQHFENSFYQKDEADNSYHVIRTFLVDLFKLLLEKGLCEEDDVSLDHVYAEIAFVHSVYFQSLVLGNSNNYNLIIAFIFYHLIDSEQKLFDAFKYWVITNKIYELDELNVFELIALFSKRMEARKGDVFVSMDFEPYYDSHYNCIKEAVEEFNRKNNRATELKELRMDKLRKGASFNIYDEMSSMIENSSLLIADLSNGNKNVYNEVGYLMGLNRAKGNPNNFILIKQKNVSNDLVGFNLKPYQMIKFQNEKDLKNELIDSLEVHFGLKAGGS